MTHKTKGIVLRAVKYGETSIITTVYTELFGVQSYILKGVRQSTKKSSARANFFQPAAILEMEVYHNELKNLQFIKEYAWSYLYENIFFNVIKNAAAIYIIELLQQSLKEPEANPDMYYLIENILRQLDTSSETFTANIPLYFMLNLASKLGFQISGDYSTQTPVFDMRAGVFVHEAPAHLFYLTGEAAKKTSEISNIPDFKNIETLKMNRNLRRDLLGAYGQFLSLHIEGFNQLKSFAVLKEVL